MEKERKITQVERQKRHAREKGLGIYEMTCVAGAWFSWEGEEVMVTLQRHLNALWKKCGCYSILEEKP